MAREKVERQQKPKAAAVVPILFREDGPYFVKMRRGAHKVVTPGKWTIAFGGLKDATDRNIRHTAVREYKEESGLRLNLRNILAHLGTYFRGGFRGKTYLLGIPAEEHAAIEQLVDKINRGEHREFDRAEIVHIDSLEGQLGQEHMFTDVKLARRILGSLRAWLTKGKPPIFKPAQPRIA